MDRNVLELITKLRLSGLHISPAEAIDCVNALQYLADPRKKKDVIAATLVKRAVDLPVFEKVYAMYYGQQHDIVNENSCKHGQSGLSKDQTEQQNSHKQQKKGWKELFEDLKHNNESSLAESVSQAVDGLGELKQKDVNNFGNLVRRTQIAMEWFMAENQLERSFWDMPYEEWLEAKERFSKLKQEIEDELRKKVERELGLAGQEEMLKQLNWKSKDFGELKDEEIIEMERRVNLLGKKLASRIGRRRKRSKKGVIDSRRLLRKAFSSPNFIPHDFSYLKKMPAKPDIAILCDISGSVARYSRFMLQLIYIFSNRFTNIKAYVFVDEITKVTDVLKDNEWEAAFDKIFREAKCSNTGFSNYGQVFESFNKKYASDINSKTSVVILGDARNNWHPSGVEEFATLAKRANKVLWLNPQEKSLWNEEDSIIKVYENFCKTVIECRSLEHLEKVIKKILAW